MRWCPRTGRSTSRHEDRIRKRRKPFAPRTHQPKYKSPLSRAEWPWPRDLKVGCGDRSVVFFWSPFDVPPPPPGRHEVARHVWHKPDTKSITHYELIIVWSREPKQKVSRAARR